MTKKTCTLKEIGNQTLIPIVDIIGFINANKAMGYLYIGINEIRNTVINIQNETQKEKIFSNKLLSTF